MVLGTAGGGTIDKPRTPTTGVRATRIQQRNIPAPQLELLARWLDAEPEVPEGEWFKRFSGMTVCGQGEFVKTFLLPGQRPTGERVK